MSAPVPAADDAKPFPPVTREFAQQIARDIAARPDSPRDTPVLLATLLREKFGATTLLRLVVAHAPAASRDDALFRLVAGALVALADGHCEAFEHYLNEIRRHLGSGLTGVGADSLDALEMTLGIVDGTQPPLF